MATLPLTEKQEKLWRFIHGCERSPTLREMCEGVGTVSFGSMKMMVATLEQRGLVRRTPGRWRSVVALAPERGTLDAWADAELIAELERRTKAAIKRADVKKPIPPPARKKGGSIFGTWQDQAREASALLLEAIDRAGVRP